MTAGAAPQRAPAPAITYSRVSKEEQARPDKVSLAQQRSAAEALARRLGRRITRRFEDAGASGGTDHRPAFRQLVAWCEAHGQPLERPGYILVLNDSRWGRWENPERAAYWRVRLADTGWQVRYAEHDEPADLVTRTVMRALHGAQATAYREAIKANAKRGARGTAAQGYWQNEAPMGYRREARDEAGRRRVLDIGQRKGEHERVRLVPGPEEEQAVVRWIFQTYAQGTASLADLARALMTRWPQRRWSRGTVHATLQNPAYRGDVVWCRTTNDPSERVDGLHRAASEWVVAEDAHPALVDRATFAAVQRRLGQRRGKTSPSPDRYLLSGLLTCAVCGEPYTGGGGRKGPPEDPDRFRVYLDRGAPRLKGVPGRCPGTIGTIRTHLIDDAVLTVVARLLASDPMQAAIARAWDRRLERLRTTAPETRHVLEGRRHRLQQQRDRLVRAIAAGTLAEAEATATLMALRAELAEVDAGRERARFAARQEPGLREARDELLALTRNADVLFQRLRGRERRQALAPWLDSLVFDKRTREVVLTLTASPAAHDVLELSGQPGPSGQAHDHAEGDDERLSERIVLPWPARRGRRRSA